jgi:hypothetical protein
MLIYRSVIYAKLIPGGNGVQEIMSFSLITRESPPGFGILRRSTACILQASLRERARERELTG